MAAARQEVSGPNPNREPYWYVKRMVGYWLEHHSGKYLGAHAKGPLALLLAVHYVLEGVVIKLLPPLDKNEYRNALRTYAERKLAMKLPVVLKPDRLVTLWEARVVETERKHRIAGAQARAFARKKGWV